MGSPGPLSSLWGARCLTRALSVGGGEGPAPASCTTDPFRVRPRASPPPQHYSSGLDPPGDSPSGTWGPPQKEKRGETPGKGLEQTRLLAYTLSS